MATTYQPFLRHAPVSWLLTNGEVIEERPVERSARKYRVRGTNDNAFHKDLNDLLARDAERVAKRRGAHVWMPMEETARAIAKALVFDPDKVTTPSLHILTEPGKDIKTSHFWWRFKHDEYPIEAYLHIKVFANHFSSGRQNEITVRLICPRTHPHAELEAGGYLRDAHSPGFRQMSASVRDTVLDPTFVDADLPDWHQHLSKTTVPDERPAVVRLLTMIRAFETLEQIRIPDFRQPSKPKWLTLHLDASNMNNEFIAQLQDFLDGGDLGEEALQHYRSLLNVLKQLGLADLSANAVRTNDLLRALEHRADLTLRHPMTAEPNVHEAYRDNKHIITIDITSGTLIAKCNLQPEPDQETVVEAWERAQVIARLTGQEDAFLGFCRQYAQGQHDRDTETILRRHIDGIIRPN